MTLYNSFSHQLEEVVAISPPKLGIYTCGPTVYDFTHIGHLRKYVFDDLLVRILKRAGFQVTHVMNITDVGHLVSDADDGEDKMEKGARKYQKSVWDLAHEFEAFFWKSLDAVHVQRPDVSCRATDHISEQIEMIQKLEKNGHTYVIEDGVYFDTSTFSRYYALSGSSADREVVQRIEETVGKKHADDFALWKFSPKDQSRQMEWESPWGKGFPGWHIECSAMSSKYLGDQFEIHTGGIDHVAVHHTNEIVQSECATGKSPFVKYWVHHNFLRVDNQKMSKSLGNFYTIDDVIAKGFSPEALRLLFLGSHYRDEQNFTWEALRGAQASLDRLADLILHWESDTSRSDLSEEKLAQIDLYRSRFEEALFHDLHSAEALAVLWEVAKSNIPSMDKFDLIRDFNEVLGLDCVAYAKKRKELQQHAQKQVEQSIPEDVRALAEARQQARVQRNFELADRLRAQLLEQGWVVEDVANRYLLKPNRRV
ncbi:MAG: Cysteine-tRNA ligase [Microgenomates group bacterium GW2011_GWF2_45_18]|nr:MAG: Cysteine-tRNA ligase [Microgenomates group bacterium GW2011_GWF1_44_10]KKU01414.1 MAG: Cysteine-tRNA ligase [Microgenomates group bacterium GW2011_GWF2_45_18]HAU98870.1 cysteine--tRNA ligase [Candidatus Paceibacterota bacterium]HAX01172.1 cysteine--tRNA ligase [Candidatus Paceibacterota bacterium]